MCRGRIIEKPDSHRDGVFRFDKEVLGADPNLGCRIDIRFAHQAFGDWGYLPALRIGENEILPRSMIGVHRERHPVRKPESHAKAKGQGHVELLVRGFGIEAHRDFSGRQDLLVFRTVFMFQISGEGRFYDRPQGQLLVYIPQETDVRVETAESISVLGGEAVSPRLVSVRQLVYQCPCLLCVPAIPVEAVLPKIQGETEGELGNDLEGIGKAPRVEPSARRKVEVLDIPPGGKHKIPLPREVVKMLIVDGHDHVAVQEGEWIGGTEIVQTGIGDMLPSGRFRVISELVILGAIEACPNHRQLRPFQLNQSRRVP